MLPFYPLPGLTSCHLQTILPAYLPKGMAPISWPLLVDLTKGDKLCCLVSTPPNWQPSAHTVAMVHGLGGSHESNYMVRLARKFYKAGHKVVRINLRGCGMGRGLSKLPYSAGTSGDLLAVLQALKFQAPASSVTLIGFSLGGNMVLKLAGELGEGAQEYVRSFIAVCPPIDLHDAVRRISQKGHHFYHRYYLNKITKQAKAFSSTTVGTLYEFDDKITAPFWGYSGAPAYYQANSSLHFIPHICHNTHLLFAEDDPFIDTSALPALLHPPIQLHKTKHGGHMGFLGTTEHKKGPFWLDHQLLEWQ